MRISVNMPPPNVSYSSRLDGFAGPPIQMSHTASYNHTYDPTNAITETSPIIFNIPASSDFIDLSRTRLKIRVKIIDDKGADMDEETDKNKFAFVCNPIGSIFKQVKLLANGQLLTPTTDFYSYKSFVDTLFSVTPESRNTLDLAGFHTDTIEQAHSTNNEGFKIRSKKANKSAIMEFSGRPAIDILKQGTNIIDGVALEFIFYQNTPEFCIQRIASHGKLAKYKILDAKLTIRKEQLDPTVSNIIHKELMGKNWQLNYPITSTKIFNIPIGSHQFNATNIFLGKIPNSVLIYFVKAENFTGDIRTSPFWLTPGEEIKEIIVSKDGVPIPNLKPSSICLKPDSLELTDTYETLLDYMGVSGLISRGIGFSPSRLALGLFFYGANLNPDTNNDDHVSPQSSGNIDVTVKWSAGTEEVYELFVVGEHDVKTEITHSRNVLHTFTV